MSEKKNNRYFLIDLNQADETPRRCDRFNLQPVNAITGGGAEELPGLTPTRYELAVLTEHWALQAIKALYESRVSTIKGCREACLPPYAERRLQRIARVLGMEEVKNIIKRVHDKFEDEWPEGYAGPVDLRDELMEVPS